jgi:hypothetical protein
MLPEVAAPKITVLTIEYILLRFLVKYQIGDIVVAYSFLIFCFAR